MPSPSSAPSAAKPQPQVIVHCDGACKGNPGPGGWGSWIQAGSAQREVLGGEPETTNNRMELRAALESLLLFKKPVSVRVLTDSQYLVKGMTEWKAGWLRRGWKDSKGQPVKNRDLWEPLMELAKTHTVEWMWVRGHDGHEGNERADRLANEGLLHAKRTRSTESLVREGVRN